jgi:hypothetical protein
MPIPGDIFTKDNLETPPKFRSIHHNLGRILKASTFSIYPLSELPALIEVLRAKVDPELKLKIRYMVDTAGKLWLAEEGGASSRIPAHYQMTGASAKEASCIAAGNITFSPDYKTIDVINHKSGDFVPAFDSLKWLLAILVANADVLAPVTLPPILSIERLSSVGGFEEACLLEKEPLIKWINETFCAEKMASFRKQPTEIRISSYEPPAPAIDERAPQKLFKPLSLFDMGMFGGEGEASSTSSAHASGHKRIRPNWSASTEDDDKATDSAPAGAGRASP